jgi:uncharacterized membrane protein YfcA
MRAARGGRQISQEGVTAPRLERLILSLELKEESAFTGGPSVAAATGAVLSADRAPAVSLAHMAIWVLVTAVAVWFAFLDGQCHWLARYSGTPATPAYCSLWVLVLAMACEFTDTTMGMGYGTMLVPLLFVLKLPPAVKEAVLLSELLAKTSATFFHHQVGNFNFWKDHSTRNTGLLIGGVGFVVAVVAEIVTIKMPQGLLRPGITVMVIAMGVFMLLIGKFQLQLRMRNMGILAGIAGFNKAFSGGGYGPLVTGGQVLSGLPVRAAVSATAVAKIIVCVAAVGTYYLHGKTIPLYLLAPMAVGAMLSTPLSAVTLRRLPARLAKRVMALVIIAIGVYALCQGRGI